MENEFDFSRKIKLVSLDYHINELLKINEIREYIENEIERDYNMVLEIFKEKPLSEMANDIIAKIETYILDNTEGIISNNSSDEENNPYYIVRYNFGPVYWVEVCEGDCTKYFKNKDDMEHYTRTMLWCC